MREEIRVTIWSILAAGMLCLVMVSASLTPLAAIGHGTRFGTSGMWYNMWFVSSGYVIPLILYWLRVHVMKYVIAVVNGFWMIPLPFIAGIAFWGSRHMLPNGRASISCVVMGFLALISLGVNILWYPVCRKKRKSNDTKKFL